MSSALAACASRGRINVEVETVLMPNSPAIQGARRSPAARIRRYPRGEAHAVPMRRTLRRLPAHFAGGDLGMLSPYYKRASVTISVSGGPGIDYWDYLLDVDAILRQYRARAHWGKTSFQLLDMPVLYPRFHDFQAIRRKIDPSGCFMNDHLRNLLERRK
jgi:D-arabinono-1,4-lactone oxidase